MLPKLNFPPYEFRFKKNEKGKLMIFDQIRKKFIELTPEEWVRQHLVMYLMNEKSYPASMFSLETGLKLNNTQKRTDVIVYDSEKKVCVLAECKAPEIKLTKSVAEQALRYNLIEKAKLLILTNGIVHLFYEINAGEAKQINEAIDYKLFTLNK